MPLALDANPIINDPFREPEKWWFFNRQTGQVEQKEGRRPSGYYLRSRTTDAQLSLFEEAFEEMKLVNDLRARVKEWREAGYPGVTSVTRRLLEHWNREDRERRLFFCQREAAETVILLVEAPHELKQGLNIPPDAPDDPESIRKGSRPLTRYALKMATGTGKTVVMAMLASWSVINKVMNRQDARFSDAVLIIAPNLTVKERLQVLYPYKEDNYYIKFDLVPASMMQALNQGKFFITNWHIFQPKDDSKSKSVQKRGMESDSALVKRTLKDLGSKKNILVINDEAHHAYRPNNEEINKLLKEGGLSAEERKELEEEIKEATVWVSALDRINSVKSINFCLDFSATPFYLKGSGYTEGIHSPGWSRISAWWTLLRAA